MEGSLGVGEYMQLNVEFKPKKVGDYQGTLTVHYSTGKLWQFIHSTDMYGLNAS